MSKNNNKRFRNNTVGAVTTTLLELNSTKIWPTGATVARWPGQKPLMINEFTSTDNCYELIVLSDPPVPSHLVRENYPFERPQEVSERIDEEISAQVGQLRDIYLTQRNIITIDPAFNDNEDQRAQALINLQENHEQRVEEVRATVRSFATVYHQEYQRKIDLYKDYEKKCQSAMKCFNHIFTREFLQQYLADLHSKRFRKVWSLICERYENANADNLETIDQMYSLIVNMDYDMSATMIETFYVYDQRVYQYRQHGFPFSDQQAIHYFIKMLERSHCHQQLKETAVHVKHQREAFTWDSFKTRMLNTFQNLVEEGKIPRALPLEKRGTYQDSATVAKSNSNKKAKTTKMEKSESANTNVQNKEFKNCDYCKSKGFSFYNTHNIKMCYQLNPCRFCFKPHNGNQCLNKTGTSSTTSTASTEKTDKTKEAKVPNLANKFDSNIKNNSNYSLSYELQPFEPPTLQIPSLEPMVVYEDLLSIQSDNSNDSTQTPIRNDYNSETDHLMSNNPNIGSAFEQQLPTDINNFTLLSANIIPDNDSVSIDSTDSYGFPPNYQTLPNANSREPQWFLNVRSSPYGLEAYWDYSSQPIFENEDAIALCHNYNNLPPKPFQALVSIETLFTTDSIELGNITINSNATILNQSTLSVIHNCTILDSGASSHMVTNVNCLTNIRPVNGTVSLGDASVKLDIIAIGDTQLLKDVLVVPKLSFNLISVSKLDMTGHSVNFRNGRVTVSTNEVILFTGTLRNNLYYLDEKFSSKYVNVTNEAIAVTTQQSTSSTMGYNLLEHLHRRWGHMSENTIKMLLKFNKVKGADITFDQVKNLHIRFCESCYRGRMKAFQSKPVTNSSYNIMEKIGMDWKGEFPIATFHNCKGFWLLADYESHYLSVHICKSRSQLLSCLQNFKLQQVIPHNYIWKILRTDNDNVTLTENVVNWLLSERIKLELSAPYRHSQNGFVERMIQTLMDKARTLMAEYNCPLKYWGYAIITAAYLLNRLYIPNGHNCTPYEAVHKKIPDVSWLKAFYSPGVVHLTPEEREKESNRGSFAYKAEPIRLLGFSEDHHKTYCILIVRTGAIQYRSDCIFDETLYTHVRQAHHRQITPLQDLLENNIIFDRSTVEEEKQQQTPVEQSNKYNLRPNKHRKHDLTAIENQMFNLDEEDDQLLSNNYLREWASDVVCNSIDAVRLPEVPSTYEEAMTGPDSERWKEAIRAELQQLDDNNVFEIAEEQYGRGMKTKLIFRIVYDNNFQLKYKARLVCCGYSQLPGLDFDETYAPTVGIIEVFIVLHICAHLRANVASFDVGGAFTLPGADCELYAWIESFLCGVRMRLKLLKALYGMKQGPKLWNDFLNKTLLDIGFIRCPVAPCVYKWSDNNNWGILVDHVDDGLVVCNKSEIFYQLMDELKARNIPKLTTVMPLKKYIGISITRDEEKGKFILNQHTYIEEMDTIGKPKIETIPMDPNISLRTAIPNPNNESLLPYIGKARFAVDRTRWDGLCVTGELASGGAKHPSDEHWKIAKQFIDYLKSSNNLSLEIGSFLEIVLFVFIDASFKLDGDGRSRIAGAFYLSPDSGAIYAASRLATEVAQASTYAELQSAYEYGRLVVHIRDILAFLGFPQSMPTKMYIDNKSVIRLVTTLKSKAKSSSVQMKIEFVRELINRKIIELHFVKSEFNVADILTKALNAKMFCPHRDTLLYGFKPGQFETKVLTSLVIVEIQEVAGIIYEDLSFD